MSEGRVPRICLVTEELSFGKGAGGIGGAFHELALTLRHAGNHVDIIFVPEFTETKAQKALTNYYDAHGIEVIDPAIDSFAWSPLSYDKRSYALYRYLVMIEEPYDFIHFHDYKGLGYFVLAGGRSTGTRICKHTAYSSGPQALALGTAS